ncbi:MAG: branched-chain amino acid ABC transporter permease, partial [Actinomycetota bacterium]|nr:branched-chain amino acid ABC transporter permease [Actinomycetota bacterium]
MTDRRQLGPGLGGAVAATIGSLSPWATFAGFPGKMSLGGFAGGARLFCLLLVAGAVLFLVDVPGRRVAALATGLGVVAVVAVNIVAMADQGGGLGSVAWGAWLTLAGGGVFAAAAYRLPPGPTVGEDWPRLPAAVEVAGIAAGLLALLGTVVWGLRINESSRFVSFLVFVTFTAVAAHHLGLFSWLSVVFARHQRIAVLLGGAVAVAFPFTQQGNAYWIRVFASIGVFAAAAIGLNVVVGLAGLLDLGYVAFFGVGAYVGALLANASLTTVHVQVPFLVVVLLGGCIAAVFGVIIGTPTLRLRGDYLAIVTLGFGEIVRIAARNLDSITLGPRGISPIPHPRLDLGIHYDFGVAPIGYYYLLLVLTCVMIGVIVRLNNSRIGRAWAAIREDEVAAVAMGVPAVRMKLWAFAIGASTAGVAGVVYAQQASYVSPDNFDLMTSFLIVAIVVLGGMGSIAGSIVGAFVVAIAPEVLRTALSG